jgi:catechol 2,3-dioxygenase-like lactoylglutathione lyase family enzyme
VSKRKGLKISGADHANWRVRDLQTSLRFYQDILDLRPFGLDRYERGESPIVSVRVSEDFVIHLRPDPDLDERTTGAYGHLALVVEDTTPEELARLLERRGVEIERRSEKPMGARGEGSALYIRDPDGFLIELKIYGQNPEPYGTE